MVKLKDKTTGVYVYMFLCLFIYVNIYEYA